MKLIMENWNRFVNEGIEKKITPAGSKCTTSDGQHRIMTQVMDKSAWDKNLFKAAKELFPEATTDAVSYGLCQLLCENLVPHHFPAGRRGGESIWSKFQPENGGPNVPSLMAFDVVAGKVSHNEARSIELGNTAKLSKVIPHFLSGVQAHVGHYPPLKNPGFKFEIIICHGCG
jgi:hypothetical protein